MPNKKKVGINYIQISNEDRTRWDNKEEEHRPVLEGLVGVGRRSVLKGVVGCRRRKSSSRRVSKLWEKEVLF